MREEDSCLYNAVAQQPPITQTCQTIRKEILPFFYSATNFVVPLGTYAFPLFSWLIAIGEGNRNKANITLRQYDCSLMDDYFGQPRRLLFEDDQELGEEFWRQYEGFAPKIKVTMGKVSAINRNRLEGRSYWEARLITTHA